jgi:hypothetical protein
MMNGRPGTPAIPKAYGHVTRARISPGSSADSIVGLRFRGEADVQTRPATGKLKAVRRGLGAHVVCILLSCIPLRFWLANPELQC